MSAVAVAEALWLLLAALGLNLAVGYAGLPVVGQGAFVAVGGYGTALLADRAGWPLGLAVLGAVGVAAVLGWLVGFGAARLHGAHLALATWALAWLTYSSLIAFPSAFGGAQGLVRPVPARLVSQVLGLEIALTPVWHVAIASLLCLGVLAATRSIARGPVGLDLAALREGPRVAASLGIPAAARRRGALSAAAASGAVAGAGTTLLLGVTAPSDVSPLLSLQLFAAVLLGGTASVLGPVIGVAALVAMPRVADAVATTAGTSNERSRGVLTAALLVLALALRRPVDRLRPRRPSPSLLPARRPTADAPPLAAPATVAAEPGGHRGLAARGVRHAYGAFTVLDGVDVDVRVGEIHALVGPNGSGKTTLLRVLAGAVRPAAGVVTVDGGDVTTAAERDRVRSGVVRTFQTTALLGGRTVGENVRAGARVTERSGVAWRALLRTPSWQQAAVHSSAAVAALLRTARLDHQADEPATAVDHGAQRVLQVTRAAATGARVLLLDEPAAGLSPAEVARLSALLRALAGNGVGILLVEHNMRLVSALADRVTVLAAGRVIASGSVDAVRRDPAVRAAYLGADA